MASEELREVIEALAARGASPAERLALARAHVAAGTPAEAVPILEGLSADLGESPDFWYLQGQALGLTEDTAGACTAWRRVLALQPGHRQALLGLAALQRAAGDLAGAAATYALGLEHHPADEFLAGRLRALAPDHPWLLVAAGDAVALDGDPEGALEYYQQAAAQAPEAAAIHWRLAWTARRSGHGDWALAAWGRAVALNPDLIATLMANGRRLPGEG